MHIILDGKPRRIWEDNIKVDAGEIDCEYSN
jgi:hypothetical protein